MTTSGGLALATRGLRKSYGSRPAVNGLDLSVPTGAWLVAGIVVASLFAERAEITG